MYDDILEGITLDSIIVLAQNELGIKVERRPISRTELYVCDEVFYYGTACQVAPIVSVDKRKVGHGKPGKITRLIQELYFDVVRGKNKKYMKWLPLLNRRAEFQYF